MAGASLAVAGFAQAQAAAPAASGDDKTVKLEKFVVTGSNIPTTETASEARTFPVQTIDRRLIEQSGIFNTSELLQKMTLSNGGSVPFTNNATGFTPGANSTSLRGLGPEATLILINGRRVAPYPVGAGGTTAFVDLNTIPLNAIDRIEVLKDGASATYGADAVAGVVNIILRRDYNGATASLTYGNTTNKDSSEFTASMVMGVTSEKGSLTVGANFQKRNPIFNRDRDFSAVPAFLSTNSSPPNFQLTRDAVLEAMGLPAGSAITINGAANTTTNLFFGTTFPTRTSNHGNVPASGYSYTTGRQSLFNYNEFSGSYPEITRRGVFGSWEREFFAPNMHFYGDFFVQQVHQIDELAPYATGNFASPGQTTIVIPSRTPNPILTPAEIAAGGVRTAVAGAYNPFNPFNQDISGSSRIRLAEFGNRVFHNRNTAFAFTSGLKIDEIAEKWSLNAVARFSEILNHTNNRLISTGRLLRALNAADPIFNPASPSYIGTTTPYNPFGYYANPIPSNTAVVNYATHYQRDENSSTMLDGGISLSTGDLMTMPAGSVGFAIGADYRREAITQAPDSALQSGEILAATPASPINKQRKIASYFTEFEIPIFSDTHSVDFARALSINLAARYESFLTSSRHAFVPKVGVRWSPKDETLVFRASWGKGFREPSLYELYAPPVAALTPIDDPVSGVFEPEQPVTIKGNSKLAAEKTKSFNVGVVWSPKGQLDGFTLAIDAWKIERDGTVASDLQNVLDRANGTIPGGLQPGESVIRDFAGNLVQVNGLYRNLGETKVDGIDIGTSYVWTHADWGRFDVGINATYMHSYKSSSNPGVPLEELVDGEVPGSNSDDAYLHWKGQAFAGWTWKGVNARLTANYTDGYKDFDLDGNPRRVDSTVFWDLQLGYTPFPSKNKADANWWTDLKLTAGCTNLFDKDPPLAQGAGGNSNGYPGFLYSDQGRFVYFGLEKKL
ncbi:MAG: TonB-dependent receptor [Opitutae bacterium]|nr:TonB-dependent receptor [Opitutae bacterium]